MEDIQDLKQGNHYSMQFYEATIGLGTSFSLFCVHKLRGKGSSCQHFLLCVCYHFFNLCCLFKALYVVVQFYPWFKLVKFVLCFLVC